MDDDRLPPRETLTPAEEALIAAIVAGRRAELDGQTIRATVLRDLAVGNRPDWRAPPVGISLNRAVIDGELDLEGCAVENPLVFLHCRFEPRATENAAVRLRDARLKRVAFYDCAVAGAIKADRAFVETAFFLTSSAVQGMVRLRGATIGEALAMDSARIENRGEIAVLADGLRLGGPWILRGASVEGSFRLRGMTAKAIDAQNIEITATSEAFNARGANVGSDLVLDGSRITGGVLLGRAHVAGEFSARGAVCSGSGQEWAIAAGGLIVDQGVSLAGAKLKGGVSLAGARINQGISASSVEIDGAGRAIEADVIHVGGNWIMRGAKIKGSVRFAGAQIDGQVGFTESEIEGGGDLALRADGASIRGGWFMGRARIRGLVRFPSARIGNEMRLRATRIEVASGPAVFANGVRIARELVLDGGFETKGGVALDHAEIEGPMDLSGSRVSSAALGRGGAPFKGAYDAVLEARYDEAALSLVDARLDRLVMPDALADRPRGVVDLSRARVGSYEDAAAAWPPPLHGVKGDTRGRAAGGRDIDYLVLDGFVYDHLEYPAGNPAAPDARLGKGTHAARMRTRWLEGQCGQDLDAHFKPQAWMQLARRLAAQGYHDDAREIAIARRRRHRRSASTGVAARWQNWFLDVFALYGFNPWRTVLWMGAFVLLFAAVWSWAATGCGRSDCKDEQVFVMALKGDFGQDEKKAEQSYPAFAPLAYSFDVFLPFVDFGFKNHWRPRVAYLPFAEVPAPLPWRAEPSVTLTLGGVLYGLYVLEMLIGLILTSLAITGFTGLLKGDEESR